MPMFRAIPALHYSTIIIIVAAFNITIAILILIITNYQNKFTKCIAPATAVPDPFRSPLLILLR